MSSILRLLVILCLAGTSSAQFGSPLVHLDVEAGRAILVLPGGVLPLSVQRGVTPFRGPGQLELAPGSRALLRWERTGSLTLAGPASVAWQEASQGGVRLEFSSLTSLDIEVRGLPMRVDLPGAWRLDLQTGAYSVYALGAGGLQLTHRAGLDARATWMGSDQVAPPPSWIRAGERFQMPAQPEFNLPPDKSSSAPTWTRSSWPWGSGVIAGAPELKLPGMPAWNQQESATSEWPWGTLPMEVEPWERWDWPWTASQPAKPQPQPANDLTPVSGAPAHGIQHLLMGANRPGMPFSPAPKLSPRLKNEPGRDSSLEPLSPVVEDGLAAAASLPLDSPARPVAPPSQTTGEQDTPLELSLALAALPSPGLDDPIAARQGPALEFEPLPGNPEPREGSSWDPNMWRGLSESQVARHANYRVQTGVELIQEPVSNGGTSISLAAGASQPFWYFSRRLDVRIFPGAKLVVGQDGYLRYHTGTIRVLSAHPSRIF